MQLAAQTLQAFFTGGGTARRHAEYSLADVATAPEFAVADSIVYMSNDSEGVLDQRLFDGARSLSHGSQGGG